MKIRSEGHGRCGQHPDRASVKVRSEAHGRSGQYPRRAGVKVRSEAVMPKALSLLAFWRAEAQHLLVLRISKKTRALAQKPWKFYSVFVYLTVLSLIPVSKWG